MKQKLLLLLSLYFCAPAFSQSPVYWQQKTDYKIDVTLNDSAKTLDGFINIQYQNNSPDTLRFIWIHCWPNAYKNDKTAFSDQLLENGSTNFYFSDEEQRGYMNRLDFRVNKLAATMEEHPAHADIIKLILPAPLPPGRSIQIETGFHVKLPYNFSRGGYIENSFQITQWYPKPAVYDSRGWHEMPYLDQGEFFAEFGDFDVQINLPKKYVVAATGKLQEQTESNDSKTLHYVQSNVHDFAWFADKDFIVEHDSIQLATHVVELLVYHFKSDKREDNWSGATKFLREAVKTKSEWLGEYPYDVVSVVQRPGRENNGGMEYPTITLISDAGDAKSLDHLINHEVGHNWFYGILASNEREHPWMDEGMNTFYDHRYEDYKLNKTDSARAQPSFIRNRLPHDFGDLLLQSLIALKKDQPIETPAADFSKLNYAAVAYSKAADWMNLLEREMGKTVFDSMMHMYYERWKFKHPYPDDFKKIVEEYSGKNEDALFNKLNTKGTLTKMPAKKLKLSAFFNFKNTDQFNYVFFSPALGYNVYDKMMVGALLHNYNLPSTRFQFFLSALYGTGSGEVNGLGRLSYNLFTGNHGGKLDIAVAAAKFTADEFTDSTGSRNYQPFQKFVPSLKYFFANKKPRSQRVQFLQWKTFLISETGVNFYRDSIQQVDIISYPKTNRYVNQLQLVVENNRKLYPYRGQLMAEQGKGFVRLNITTNYFLNYPKAGGLDVRLFAGKFIYTGDKTFSSQFETDRYHLNMSGPKGFEDYTYSNYFVGRNEFDGTSNQQIMKRDGAFKVKTDLLSDKVGRSDDWLAALNFTTSIPKKINPLQVLPFTIPVRIFFDIGANAEGWKTNGTDSRFLYDAGLQLSFLKNTVNIYFPVLYSKVYRDYFKSNFDKVFKRNICFSIDIQNISLRKFYQQIDF